jgi:hypothetical protein
MLANHFLVTYKGRFIINDDKLLMILFLTDGAEFFTTYVPTQDL